MSELIINDDNYNSHINFEDRGKGLNPRDWEKVTYGNTEVAAAITLPLIPRAEWPDRIADMVRTKTRISDIVKDSPLKIKDQKQTNYCHANSPARVVEILRLIQGQSYVELSPGSIGGPITNFTNSGAWILDDLKQVVKGGVASTDYVPLNQISKAGWKQGAVENALLHQVTEWVEIPRGRVAFDYCMTLALCRIPVCVAYNWWRHATTVEDPYMDDNGKFGLRESNSWGTGYGQQGYFILMEGKGTPDESYAPSSTELAKV